MTIAESVFWHGVSAVLRVIQPFRKETEQTTTVVRDERDYEWQAKLQCFGPCRRADQWVTTHHFIEWLPERTVTMECLECGTETELPW